MTTIRLPGPLSGSAPPVFLSSTVPSSATRAAIVKLSAFVAGAAAACAPSAGTWSNSPTRNIVYRMRLTMSLSVAVDTWPLSTALCSAGP